MAAHISRKRRVFLQVSGSRQVSGFVCVSHFSCYQKLHADHNDAEPLRTKEAVDLFLVDPLLSLKKKNYLSNEVLPWIIYPHSLVIAEHPS